MTPAAIEATGNIDHICQEPNNTTAVSLPCTFLGQTKKITGGFQRREIQITEHRISPTSKCCSSSKASSNIHGGDSVPNTVLVRRVVQALHGAEPRPAVIASDHINSIVQRHCGHVTPFPCNILFKTQVSNSIWFTGQLSWPTCSLTTFNFQRAYADMFA